MSDDNNCEIVGIGDMEIIIFNDVTITLEKN
jgi:hypothetical protein